MKISSLYLIVISIIVISFYMSLSVYTANATANTDSLLKLIDSEKADTAKVDILNRLSENFFSVSPDSGIKYGHMAQELGEKNNYLPGLAASYSALGLNYLIKGDINTSLDNYFKALKIFEDIKDSNGIALCTGNIGMLNVQQEKYDEALKYFDQSLDIHKSLGLQSGIANILIHQGNIYTAKGNNPKALELYQNSLKLCRDINDRNLIANNTGNIANLYLEMGSYAKALPAFRETLLEYRALKDNRQIAYTLFNLSILYKKWAKQASGNKEPMTDTKKLNLALDYGLQAQAEAEAINLGELLYQIYENQSQIYELQNNNNKALLFYKKFHTAKDSMFNMEKSEEIGRIEAGYEFEKKQREQEIKAEMEARLEAEKIEYRNNLQYLGITIFIFILFISIFLIPRMNFSSNLIEGFVFVTFLLFYEFVLVFLEPWVDDFTHNVPLFKLGINFSIALLFLPVHSIEKKLRKKYAKQQHVDK